MAKQGFKRFGWVIKDFSSLQCAWCCSVPVLIGDSKCLWSFFFFLVLLSGKRLVAYSNGNNAPGYLSLFLETVLESLPCGWRRYAEYRFTIVNQRFETHSVHKKGWRWFDKNTTNWGFTEMIPVFNLVAINGGFLLNGELMIIAEVEVLEDIDTLSTSQVEEISDDSERRAHDHSSSSDQNMENKDNVTIEVNGFQVLDSQVTQVKAIFEKHPELTWNLKLKNQQLRNAYMGVLLDLIKTLCKSPKELTVEDLKKADNTLSDLVKAGLNLEWLQQKLDQALEKHIAYYTRIRELEKHVKKRKLALAELEADLEKEKAAASASLMLID